MKKDITNDVMAQKFRQLKSEVDRLLAASFSRWQIEDCLRVADFKRDMSKEAGWKLMRDVEPVLVGDQEVITKITIVDIFSNKHSRISEQSHPEDFRYAFRTGEVLAYPEEEFGCRPMGQRDAEFIIKIQEIRNARGQKGGFAGIPENQINQNGIDGYFGELAFPGTVWVDIGDACYFPVLFWNGFGFYMAFVPMGVSWTSTAYRQVGLPTFSLKK